MLQKFAEKSVSPPDISVQMLPKALLNVPTMSLVTIGAPLMFVIAYVYFLQYLTVILVSEKETNMKDHMLMMGMRESAYW